MKIGSVVECIDIKFRKEAYELGIVIPKINTPYNIRNIYVFKGRPVVLLVEIKNEFFRTSIGQMLEAGYKLNRFRELQLPDDIEEIIRQELQLK